MRYHVLCGVTCSACMFTNNLFRLSCEVVCRGRHVRAHRPSGGQLAALLSHHGATRGSIALQHRCEGNTDDTTLLSRGSSARYTSMLHPIMSGRTSNNATDINHTQHSMHPSLMNARRGNRPANHKGISRSQSRNSMSENSAPSLA